MWLFGYFVDCLVSQSVTQSVCLLACLFVCIKDRYQCGGSISSSEAAEFALQKPGLFLSSLSALVRTNLKEPPKPQSVQSVAAWTPPNKNPLHNLHRLSQTLHKLQHVVTKSKKPGRDSRQYIHQHGALCVELHCKWSVLSATSVTTLLHSVT